MDMTVRLRLNMRPYPHKLSFHCPPTFISVQVSITCRIHQGLYATPTHRTYSARCGVLIGSQPQPSFPAHLWCLTRPSATHNRHSSSRTRPCYGPMSPTRGSYRLVIGFLMIHPVTPLVWMNTALDRMVTLGSHPTQWQTQHPILFPNSYPGVRSGGHSRMPPFAGRLPKRERLGLASDAQCSEHDARATPSIPGASV